MDKQPDLTDLLERLEKFLKTPAETKGETALHRIPPAVQPPVPSVADNISREFYSELLKLLRDIRNNSMRNQSDELFFT